MKLLSTTDARNKKKLENDALIDSNIRLREYYQGITQKLNTIKESYEPDKLQKLKEFEQFCKDLEVRREKVLTELAQWQKLVADTKEMYYSLVTKQDHLQEVKYRIEEENKKLNLRESFVLDLEEKWRNKQ